MKLHLNLSLRRALLAAMAAVATFASSATAGVVDTRYDLQYYLDFSRNAGAFTAGATNVKVGYSDGSAAYTIPLMPYLGGFAQVSDSKALDQQLITHSGGAALVLPQFVYGAAHVFDQVKSNFDEGRLRYTFTDENAAASTAEVYAAANIDTFGHDGGVSRTTKLVTAVAYTPMATDAFMAGLNSSTWLYRLGNGGYWDSNGTAVSTGSNAIGGIINMDSYSQKANGDWYLYGTFRENGETSDPKTPLDNGVFKGDSGSPLFAWDDEQDRFVFVGSLWASNCHKGFGNDVYARYNPTLAQEAMAKYTVNATFSGTDTIAWSASDATTGEGTLTQGDTISNYSGKGSANAMADTKGLSFATDSATQQEIQLQGNVNMGAGALTFTKGDWKITEAADYTLSSAGFEVQGGASLTLELTGTSGEEIRKVGEGTLTIAGSGKNEAALVVGGGTVIYNVEYKDGQIAGCTLGNAGETRLNRQEGYAASSVRLEGGVAIIVLMRDGQFKTDSGDTFTFGNDGGLLNLNGHDLTWGVINQDDSGKGARIGNFTPLGEATPGLSTFTYTGTGQFDGCFVDESNGDNDGKAQLAVVYNNATNDASWKLTGNNTNVGGYTVQAGTMILEGINTKHVRTSDANDWTFASIDGSDVTVQSGAKFQLSHHAKLVGDVIVEDGGKFIMNQAVNADYESDSGSSKINMAGKEFTTLVGDVRLNGNSSTMTANVQSSAITKIDGSIRMENYDWDASPTLQFVKEGNGILAVSGNVGVPVVEIRGGGLVIEQANALDWHQWTIGKEGFLAAIGVEHSTALDFKVNKTSDGVFALTYDQTTALNLTNKQNLYIGAWGEVHYGNAEASLSANNEGNWLLGGGTGTLIVDFKLTGDKDLIVGNEWSSGTVHLTNTGNDIKDIYIKGTGNKLTYESVAALGGATISLSYGNALGLYDANLLEVVNANSTGVLALASSADLNVGGRKLAMGALGDLTYQGNISLGDGDFYRFGGSGNLTVDTALNASGKMLVDGQGTTGSSVTFARENAFTGDIIVGGGLELETPNSQGDIALHAGHSSALAAANSINLQKGANFYTDGQNLIVQNLNAQSGSTISNNGSNNSSLVLYVTAGVNTSIANGVLNDNTNTAGLGIIKSGKGTVTMGENANWSGGLVIEDGKVEVSTAIKGTYTPSGGVGSSANTIYIGENGTLRVTASPVTGWNLYGTYLTQTVTGTGTIEIASGGSMLLTRQKTAFEGTVHVVDNTRLYLAGGNGFTANADALENLTALNSATIQVDAGSQVRLTPLLRYSNNTNKIHSYSDFIISGDGFAGRDSGLVQSGLNAGALAIDCGATVWGDVTLAADASISSSSSNPCDGAGNITTSYGVKNHLGGTIRGQILGEGKTLTIKGNESMTITADSANTYGNLVIANGNGNNTDKFALRLNGGKAVSQTSTALGKGEVTLNDKLILRLAGTGTANQTDVVYTYANNIAAGNGATIQSYNITNKLTGVVKAAGDLNLATAQGGVLNLAGGVSGSGTLNIGAASKVVLGDGVSSTVTFGGNVEADAGADLTLESAASLATTSTITGTDSLSLRLNGTTDYTLGGISVTGGAAALTLSFDFTKPEVSDWSTLNSDISAGSITIALDLNMFNEISSGEYTLISGNLPANGYALDASLGNRFGYRIEGGNFILVVGGDDRLYWSAEGSSQNWTESNWHVGGAGNLTSYSGSKDVMLTHAGLSSANNREMISVAGSLTVGQVNVSSLYGLEGAGSLAGTKLAVGAGGDLLLGVESSFTNGVLVNDAALTVQDKKLTASITAENGAEVNLNGTTLVGNISVDDTSALEMTNAKLNGEITNDTIGTMITGSVSTNNSNGVVSTVTRKEAVLSGSVSDAGGNALSLASGEILLKGAINLDSLSVAGGAIATVWNDSAAAGAQKNLEKVVLSDNAIFQSHDAYKVTAATNVKTLQLSGGTSYVQDTFHSGYFSIDTLELGKGVDSSVLVLKKTASSGVSTVFNLGSPTADAGNFAGQIVLNESNSGDKRSAFIVLSNENIARNAVVTFDDVQSGSAYAGLGVNAENARIAGLESYSGDNKQVKIFSGSIDVGTDWNNGHAGNGSHLGTVGTALRTLTIDTGVKGDYTFHGEVLSNLNMVKDGAGKQTFSGNSANFNGSIEILEGTLAFTGDALGMLGSASSVTVNGGTLDISSYDFNNGSLDISNFTFSENAVLALGNLQADTSYNFFNTALENWTSLTADNFTINGTELSNLGRTVNLSLGMDGSFTYGIEGATLTWQGGNGQWDTSTFNWDITPDVAGDSTSFYQKDNVVFNDAASNKNVQLMEDITAGAMSIESGSYRFYGAQSLSVDTLTIAGKNITTEIGNSGAAQTATELTVNLNSNVAGTLDLYWSNAGLNLKGDNHEIGGIILRGADNTASALNLNAARATVGSIQMWNNSSASFGLAENADSASYSVGSLAVLKNPTKIARTITVQEGVTLNVTNDYTIKTGHALVVDGNLNINNLTYTKNDGDATAAATTWQGAGTITVNGTTDIESGSLTIAGGSVNFNGSTTISGGTLAVSGGAVNFNGATTMGSLSMTGGTVNFATNSLTVNGSFAASGGAVLRFRQSESAQSTSSVTEYTIGGVSNDAFSLIVDKNVKVNMGSLAQKAYYPEHGSVIAVDGELNIDGSLELVYRRQNQEIKGSGLINVANGLTLQMWWSGGTKVDISAETLNIGGDLSLNQYSAGYSVNILGGSTTVDKMVNHSSGRSDICLNINGGNLMMNGGANMTSGETSISAGSLTQSGGSSTISNKFSMSGGALNVRGGVMNITSTPTISGGAVNVTGGSLALTDAAAEALMGTAGATFTLNGGTLDLSALTFGTTANSAISLSSTSGLSLQSGTIAFGALEAGTEYQIFSFADGGRISGWDTNTLTAENFTINGSALSGLGKVNLILGANGTFSYSLDNSSTLYWDGGATGTWNTTSTNWDATSANGDASDNQAFTSGDSVIFTSSADVTLGEAITAGALDITNNAMVALNAGSHDLSYNSLTVDAGAKLQLTSNSELLLNEALKNVSGDGIISISQNAWIGANDNQTTTSGFTGTIQVTGGTLYLGDGDSHNNLHSVLYDKATIELSGGGVEVFGSAMALDKIAVTSSGTLGIFEVKNSDDTPADFDVREIEVDNGKTLTINKGNRGDQSWHVRMNVGALLGEGSLVFNDCNGGRRTFNFSSVGTATTAFGSITNNGETLTLGEDSGSVVNVTSLTNNSGNLTIKGNATLGTVTISGGTVKSTGATFGKEGGTITMTGGKLSLSGESAQSVLSALNVAGDALLVNEKTNVTSVLTRTLSSVDIATGATLELQTVPYNTNDAGSCKGAAYWYINNLSGAGDLKWTSYSYHDNKASHLVLGGDGSSFTGKVIVNRDFDQSAGGYQTYVELASDNAAKNAILSLNGQKANAVVALAVNTKEAEVGGLDSSEFAHLYSGAAVVDKKSSADAVAVTNSSIANTLAITGSGTYNFAGTVGRAADTASLNLAMTGAGKQTFSGTTYVGDVTVKKGTLALNGASTVRGDAVVSGGELQLNGNASVGGNMSVAKGATLSVADAFSIESAAGVDSSASAMLRGPVKITQATDTAATSLQGMGTAPTELSNALLSIASGASLRVEDMLITGGSRITGLEAVSYTTDAVSAPSVTLVDTTIALGGGNATVGSLQSLTVDIALQSVSSGTLDVTAGTSVLTVDSTALSNLLLTSSSSFVVDFGSLFAGTDLTNVDFLYLNFEGVSYEQPTSTNMVGMVDGQEYEAYYAQDSNTGWVGGVYFDVRVVPEPTTSTLSLLALAGLCARRRRKD